MFDASVAAAVAAFFLGKSGDRKQNDLRLMKLFYLTDRESLSQTGSPIMMAKFYSLPNGPVLSEVWDLMRGKNHDPRWHDHIEFVPFDGVESNHCLLVTDLDPAEHLSVAELELLETVWKEYGSQTKWDLVDLTHTFPEWDSSVADPSEPSRSRPILVREILVKGFNISEKDADAMADEINYFRQI